MMILNKLTASVALWLPLLCACSSEQSTFSIELTNPYNYNKTDEPVVLSLNEFIPNKKIRSARVTLGDKKLPYQLDDLNNDFKNDELAFLVNMEANTQKTIKIELLENKKEEDFRSRVFAELKVHNTGSRKAVPLKSITIPGTTDFYSSCYHHGVALESELVGYRIYFNEKQTLDPYGKFNKRLEIEESGFYPNDEQLKNGFGDDVLLVGNTCGIGALKGWNGDKAIHTTPVKERTQRVVSTGPIRAIVETEVRR